MDAAFKGSCKLCSCGCYELEEVMRLLRQQHLQVTLQVSLPCTGFSGDMQGLLAGAKGVQRSVAKLRWRFFVWSKLSVIWVSCAGFTGWTV